MIRAQLKVTIKNNYSINQLFIFMTQKSAGMRVAAKHQLVYQSAAPYCCKLTPRKLPNTTTKKKKKLHECAKLAKNMLFFSIKQWAQITFAINTINRKKTQKYKEKNTKK